MLQPVDLMPNAIVNRGVDRSIALGKVLYFEALMRRRLGEVRAQRYVRLHNYYANQALPADNVDQPLGINRAKTIVDKHMSYLWGQYDKKKGDLISWRVTPKGREDLEPDVLADAENYARRIKNFLTEHLGKGFNKVLWECSKNASLYGDGILEARYDEIYRKVVVESILPEYFHCIWDISNMTNLREVIIAYPIPRDVALEQYGTSGNDAFLGYQAVNPHYLPGVGVLWKHWSTTSFQTWVDDHCVINAPNPYIPIDPFGNMYPGVIPYIHIKNMPGGSDYYGYSDVENVLLLIDELNRRMADIGDITSYHAHPIITLTNYTGKQKNLEIGPDALWDLGREGKADRLEGSGPSKEALAYIDAIRRELFETSSMPESAFGGSRGQGQSHTSGIALAMAMMPVVERATEKRLYWREGLRQLAQMVFWMLFIRDPEILKAAGLSYPIIRLFDIEPVFADILPKDELQNINENVATYANGLRSLVRALESLGEDDIAGEVKRILADMQMKASVAQPTPPAEGGSAGKNSEDGMGGSPGIPGSISPSLSKPGTLIQSPQLDKVDNVSISSEPD
jgi:hypothetical protein